MTETKKQKTILVTGGAGLIGSHLIEELVKNSENRVISLDNYFIGLESSHVEGCEYIKGDTKNIEKLITVVPDLVFHLGEYSRVEQSFEDIEMVWDFNITGTFAVLEFCRKHGCKIVYAGSSTKFADGGMGRDQSPYAWMKATNTDLVRRYSEWFEVPYAITYFYNVYGDRELAEGKYASVMGRFKTLFKNGEPITVVSPGTQLRNFTHVKDIVRGLMQVGEKGEGDEYGLGSHEKISMLELANLFTSNIKMLPERKGNRMDAKVETTRAEKEFGWKAEYSVRDYVKKIVDEAK